MKKKFLAPKEAAEYLGITETQLQDLVSKNQIPFYKIAGEYIRFKMDDLELFRRKGFSIADRIKDFFYFNDFYIISFLLMVVILYFIFR